MGEWNMKELKMKELKINDMKTKIEEKKVKMGEKITRKEALKKAGKYAAFTVAAAIILLSPKEAQADCAAPDGRGFEY